MVRNTIIFKIILKGHYHSQQQFYIIHKDFLCPDNLVIARVF